MGLSGIWRHGAPSILKKVTDLRDKQVLWFRCGTSLYYGQFVNHKGASHHDKP